jgi:hypothetical protein
MCPQAQFACGTVGATVLLATSSTAAPILNKRGTELDAEHVTSRPCRTRAAGAAASPQGRRAVNCIQVMLRDAALPRPGWRSRYVRMEYIYMLRAAIGAASRCVSQYRLLPP